MQMKSDAIKLQKQSNALSNCYKVMTKQDLNL